MANEDSIVSGMSGRYASALFSLAEDAHAAGEVAAALKTFDGLVAESAGIPHYRLVYQSRSGAPGQPWLGPDVLEYLRELSAAGLASDVVLAPIGFGERNFVGRIANERNFRQHGRHIRTDEHDEGSLAHTAIANVFVDALESLGKGALNVRCQLA